jgi:hypothetical protein
MTSIQMTEVPSEGGRQATNNSMETCEHRANGENYFENLIEHSRYAMHLSW